MLDFSLPAPALAPRLLGCTLCRRHPDGSVQRLPITETEAYFGEEDTACHAHHGKTKRTAPLYRRGGLAYIYLCYGMYDLLNAVSGEEGHPEAVLIRGVKGFDGPGKLTRAMRITRDFLLTDLSAPKEGEGIWIEDRDRTESPEYDCLPRVGIGYASEEDQARLWRFRVKTH